MSFLYVNSNLSGIGDRLFDLILVYTYAKYLNYNKVYLHWFNNNDMINGNSIYSELRKTKTPFREKDYLLENLVNYIMLPDDIIFIDKTQLNIFISNKNIFKFNEYMGLKYSVYNFINKYLNFLTIKEKNNFINLYYSNFKKIKYKNIPKELSNIFTSDIITIHLRRGDKVVNDNNSSNNIGTNELINLNYNTELFINKCIELNYKNICFVSDEENIKEYYINKFKNKCNIISYKGDEISQTYFDLYCLTNSKKIFLSQKFSVFSMLAAMIGGVDFYYIYEDGKIIDNKFKYYYNIHNYKEILSL